MGHPFLMALIAIVLGLLSCHLLHRGWQQMSWISTLGGAIIFAASFPFWASVLGPEFGAIFATSMPALLVWRHIISERKILPEHLISLPKQTLSFWSKKKALSNVLMTLFVFIILMLASAIVTTIGVYLLPVSEINQMAVGALLFPVIWGVFAFWCTSARQPRVPIISICFAAIIGGLYLFI